MRRFAVVLLLAVPAAAAPGEEELLARWAEAGPGERMEIREELDRIAAQRRFVEARCVVVPHKGKLLSLAEVFGDVLEPALRTPPRERTEDDLGLEPIHLEALEALRELRRVHRAPRPAGAATLNLLLTYARDALDAWRLPPRLRLRFFSEALENVGELQGRARPDARTGWIVNHGILPALLGMARRFERDERVREAISEAASRLSMPSVLDDGAQGQLASLTRGSDARAMLERAYHRGHLGDFGVRSLARSVLAQGRDDDAYVAGAAPLLLELLGDEQVSPALRGRFVDLVLQRMAPVGPLRPAATELLAAAYGEPPRPLDQFAARRREKPGAVPRPEGGEEFRFLQVVLLRPSPGAAPEVARVVRRDVRFHDPIRAADRSFVGMLVLAADGVHADFLGPAPGLRGVPDNRLLRRTLVLERIAIRTYGARAEELELCVALPRDESEPVPVKGARLDHVLDLIRGRLERTQDADENAALADLLVRIGTPAAREMAIRFARKAADASSLLDLLERGDTSAAKPLLATLDALEPAELERALAALLALRDDPIRERIAGLAAKATIAVAAPAGDALLKTGDVGGVRALLRHEDPYARLCGAGLALRLTPLAGGLRIIPGEKVPAADLAELAANAFPKKMGGAWRQLGQWLPRAITRPHEVTTQRTRLRELHGNLSPARFAAVWAAHIEKGEREKAWPALCSYVLDPANPGLEIPPAALDRLLDRIEQRAGKDPVRRAWIDALVVLAVVQSGLEFDTEFLDLANKRLRRVAGGDAPAGARRRPGLYWPIWAAAATR